MKNHLRANLWLLLLTVGILCVAYPAALLLVSRLFPAHAAGSLITEMRDSDTIVRGSSLIAQPFTKEWYFQPRPSAVSYNATASGASNYGASNPKLRDRVARQLGPMVQYNPNPDGTVRKPTVQEDIEAWFKGYQAGKDKSPLVVAWARENPTLAAAWIRSDDNRPAVIEWLRGRPSLLEGWRKAKLDELRKADPNATVPEPKLDDESTIPFDDLAVPFFESWAALPEHKNRWPEPEEFETGTNDAKGDAVKAKRFKPVTTGKDLHATFFDLWLRDHPDADIKKVPADMVMTSASGLDPHITMRNALYQIDGVIDARAKAARRTASDVRSKVEAILKQHSFIPLSGLIGEPLVNVLEVNRAMDEQIPVSAEPAKGP